jgi:hypothetical protein
MPGFGNKSEDVVDGMVGDLVGECTTPADAYAVRITDHPVDGPDTRGRIITINKKGCELIGAGGGGGAQEHKRTAHWLVGTVNTMVELSGRERTNISL